jgi:hypothetical protein
MGTLIYMEGLVSKQNQIEVKVYNVILLIFVFYRGFSFLRIFDMFTSLVGMIIIILKRLTVFFLILLYLYLCSSVLIIKLTGTDNIVKTMGDVYYWIILASIEDYAFDTPYAAIPIVLGSIFVTIIIINMLIAYLSNLFSRLEEQQRVQELTERASLILDKEVFVMFFKYFITGKMKLRKQFEVEIYRQMLKGNKNSNKIGLSSQKKTKNLREYLAKEKYLYIFRRINWAKDISEENIYQRIRNLEKNINMLGSLINKRSRAQESQIAEVLKIVQTNSNNQDKTVDDLQKIMVNNSKNVYENTESMLIKIEKQQKKIDAYIKKIGEIEQQIGENNHLIQDVVDQLK